MSLYQTTLTGICRSAWPQSLVILLSTDYGSANEFGSYTFTILCTE